MKNRIHNSHGFTLIEMMIVLGIISVLLLILIPNMTKNSEVVGEKSCEATIRLVQSQIGAYEIAEDGKKPTSMDDLKGYFGNETIKDNNGTKYIECPNSSQLTINETTGEIEIDGESLGDGETSE